MGTGNEYPENLTQGFYRVVESEEEPSIILGAFRVLSNAKKLCDLYPGSYVVYDSGVKIYPEDAEGPGSGEEPGGQTGEEVPGGYGSGGDDPAGGDGTGGGSGADGAEDGKTTGEEGGGADDAGTSGGGGNPDGTDDSGETEGSGSGEGTGSDLGDGGNTGDTEEPSVAGETGDGGDPDDGPDDGDEPPGTDGRGEVIAYGKLKTVMNIRAEPTSDSAAIAIYNAKAIVQILEFCGNGWLKIICPESASGIGYVSNAEDQYAYIGYGYYVVTAEGDRLESIAERLLGDEARYMEIRTLNMLTSNQTYVGMELILPAI